MSACDPGYMDCNGVSGDGCEALLATDHGNCGVCGHVCVAGANSVPECASGACGAVCDPGFGDCDGQASTGCEANLNTDRTHCGTCGTRCGGGTRVCRSGVCSA